MKTRMTRNLHLDTKTFIAENGYGVEVGSSTSRQDAMGMIQKLRNGADPFWDFPALEGPISTWRPSDKQ